MARHVKIWYDPEGDFLKVLFSDNSRLHERNQ